MDGAEGRASGRSCLKNMFASEPQEMRGIRQLATQVHMLHKRNTEVAFVEEAVNTFTCMRLHMASAPSA
jgi:hypothetical protein